MPRKRAVKRKYWPRLTKINPKDHVPRENTPETVKKILEPLPNIDIGDVSSPESDITDPFEDIHKESSLHSKETGRRNITRYDVLTMSKFSDLHKSVMRDLKEKLKIGENLLNETYDDVVKAIECPKEQKPLRPETIESIRKTLSNPGTVKFIDVQKVEGSEMSYDYKELIITPQNYDAYNQPEKHWLARPSVPQEILDDSKRKCYKWLSEHHE